MQVKKVNNKISILQGRPEDISGRTETEIKTYDFLDSLGVSYLRIDHDPAMTMSDCEEADKLLEAQICKNLFLCNRQQTEFYILMIDSGKKFMTSVLSKQLGVSRLSFGSAENMKKYLGVTPGSLSVLGLMNDTEGKVRLLLDSDILNSEYIGAHPCVNTSSLKFRTEDLISKIIPATGHTFETVSI